MLNYFSELADQVITKLDEMNTAKRDAIFATCFWTYVISFLIMVLGAIVLGLSWGMYSPLHIQHFIKVLIIITMFVAWVISMVLWSFYTWTKHKALNENIARR